MFTLNKFTQMAVHLDNTVLETQIFVVVVLCTEGTPNLPKIKIKK